MKFVVLVRVTMKSTDFWDVTSCHVQTLYRRLREDVLLPSSGKIFTVYRDFGDSTFLRRVRKFLQDYTALPNRRQHSSVVDVFMVQFQPEMSA